MSLLYQYFHWTRKSPGVFLVVPNGSKEPNGFQLNIFPNILRNNIAGLACGWVSLDKISTLTDLSRLTHPQALFSIIDNILFQGKVSGACGRLNLHLVRANSMATHSRCIHQCNQCDVWCKLLLLAWHFNSAAAWTRSMWWEPTS